MKISRYFTKSQAPVTPVTSEESPVPPAEIPMPEIPLPETPAREEEPLLPHWLAHEDTLRDEGVIYGLSGTDPQGKINSITALYKKHTAVLIRTQEELTEKIGELNLILEKKNSARSDLQEKTAQVFQRESQLENSLRVVAGLILALGMCAGNYFLVREGIQYGFPNHAAPIAWGVFLSGMFSLYATTSVIHSDASMTWKRAVEELGMPFAASLFVYVQAVPHLVWYRSAGLFLFIFFAFLLSGKLLLGTLAQLKKELRVARSNAQLKKARFTAATDWPQAMELLEKEMENIRLEKWKIIRTLNETEGSINQINAEKDAAVSIFLSEYHLASDYKDRLSGTQISKILNK